MLPRRRPGPAPGGRSSTTAWTSRASRASAPASIWARGTCRPRPRGRSCRRVRRSASRPTIPRRPRGPSRARPRTTSRSGRSSTARPSASARLGAWTRLAAWPRPRPNPSSPSAGSRSTGSTPSGTRGADAAAMIGALYADGRIEENARAALDARAPPPPAAADLSRRFHGERQVLGRTAGGGAPRPPVRRRRHRDRAHLGAHNPSDLRGVGETAFREREAVELLEGIASLPGVVVATGGGAFAQEEARRTIARLWDVDPARRSPRNGPVGGFRTRPTGRCSRASSSSPGSVRRTRSSF